MSTQSTNSWKDYKPWRRYVLTLERSGVRYFRGRLSQKRKAIRIAYRLAFLRGSEVEVYDSKAGKRCFRDRKVVEL